MFKFSIDEFIASKQRENADKLIIDLYDKCVPHHSPEIEQVIEECKIDSYDAWVEINGLTVKGNQKRELVIVGLAHDYTADQSQWDLKQAFDKLDKPWKDPIPYIEHTFTDPKPHGERMKHAFLFFFTPYHEYEASRDCTIYHIKKFHNLRAFL